MVNGTLVWYYLICRREAWLMAHNLEPEQENESIEMGRFLHDTAYPKERKEILFGHMKVDVLRREGDKWVIGEVKKSSRFQQSATMQLLFYIRELRKAGIDAEGELQFPEEKRKVSVQLTPRAEEELENVIREIEKIIESKTPPSAEWCRYCQTCAYSDFCWA
ncbi:CRISPR-associated protein Cas4 [Paludifilum halophilum]|uniref:CRISPR-associated protein Cas4 n=1 Tax=Paludifilum halophilum TaxID=1642702 RepID=UPI00198052E3|nr:CRISPR-associated protein Cas4 [Paludifilum halophilum]